MGARLTEEQQHAVTSRSGAISLSAGAGSGKTTVLTERFLSHLDPAGPDAPRPVELSELIALTFTDAAAREMRTRIRGTCLERLRQADSPKERTYWWRLVRALSTARVSTIHSFCARFLRRHALDIGLDPDFTPLTEGTARVLKMEAIEAEVRRRLRDDPTLAEIVPKARVENLVSRLYDNLEAAARPEVAVWLERSPEDMVDIWQLDCERKVVPALLKDLATGSEVRRVLAIFKQIQGTNEKWFEKQQTVFELIEQMQSERATFSDALALRKAAVLGRLSLGSDNEAEDKERVRKAFKGLTTRIDDMKKNGFEGGIDPAACRPYAEQGLRFLGVAVAAAERYQEEKRRRGVIDFADMIRLTVNVLHDPAHAELAQQMAGGCRAVLIDEFQDTSPDQMQFVEALCGGEPAGDKLFFVGDLKQSIYRFRGAMPRVFTDLRAQVPEAGRQALTINFRSQPAILDFVNATFAEEFPDEPPLAAARPQTTDTPAVEMQWIVQGEIPKEDWNASSSRGIEAAAIGRWIREALEVQRPIVAERSTDGEEVPRPVRKGDIVILLRTLNDAPLLERALQAEGIEYDVEGGTTFYAQQEIADVLNLLRAVASPADEIALAGALRSPFFSLHDETLFWLVEYGGSLLKGLDRADAIKELDASQRNAAIRAAQTLAELGTLKDVAGVAALLQRALDRTGYDAALLAEFMGVRKLANLEKLLDEARATDQAGLKLWQFVWQLSHFVAHPPRERAASTASQEEDNVVRIMTIHASKGLEYPVVILPDLDRRRNRGHGIDCALDERWGPLIADPESAEESGKVLTGLELYKWKDYLESQQEDVRLFYVACTRARDFLLLSSSMDDLAAPKSMPMQVLDRRFDLATGDLRGDLPGGLAEPEVQVSVLSAETIEPKPSRGTKRRLAEALQKMESWPAMENPVHAPQTNKTLDLPAATGEYSFSQLTGVLQAADADDEPASRYSNRQQAGSQSRSRHEFDALLYGEYCHTILELVSLDAMQTQAKAAELTTVAQRVAAHLLAKVEPAAREQAMDSAKQQIERFFESVEGKHLCRAPRVEREIEFLLNWPPQAKPQQSPRLRGVIDCAIFNGERWTILDYKTNRVKSSDLTEAAVKYHLQLQCYAIALEAALGEPVSELVLYFLHVGEAVAVAWDEEARQKCIEKVAAAMGALQS